MRPLRSTLLWASTSPWLARRLPTWPFARRAVRRFMPGEGLGDALGAAASLGDAGFPTLVTQLGENVSDEAAVNAVVEQYEEAMRGIFEAGLDCQLSVKPTHLGLDLSEELCLEAHQWLASASAAVGGMLWLDMESSAYTDATLRLFRRLRRDHGNVGLCLQANLRRTGQDLAQLLPLGPSIRLVKGAYAEPATVAWTRKAEVDAAYLQLAQQLLTQRSACAVTGIATHDTATIRHVARLAEVQGLGLDDFELQMLYGIRPGDQEMLREEGYRVRVLISYGSHWFPWYMRRLAERPANVWFVASSMFTR
jgi:proline dehydrogenase